MNVQRMMEEMQSSGIELCMDNGLLRANSVQPLNDEQRQYLKQHKIEILQYLVHLEAANQSKRYAYRFTLKNNAGGGTYITDCPPGEAKDDLLDKFIGRDLKSIVLLN